MVIAETFVVAETLWIPMRAIEVGREIISMIEADRDKKGILQEIGNKIQNVNNVLELIEKNRLPTKGLHSKDWNEFSRPTLPAWRRSKSNAPARSVVPS